MNLIGEQSAFFLLFSSKECAKIDNWIIISNVMNYSFF